MKYSSISDEKTKKLYRKIKKLLQTAASFSETASQLLTNLCLLEQLKQELLADVEKRGVVELFINGEQQFFRANPSVSSITKVIGEQRRILAALKLPAELPLSKADLAAEQELSQLLDPDNVRRIK